jgi:hypothetical protein
VIFDGFQPGFGYGPRNVAVFNQVFNSSADPSEHYDSTDFGPTYALIFGALTHGKTCRELIWKSSPWSPQINLQPRQERLLLRLNRHSQFPYLWKGRRLTTGILTLGIPVIDHPYRAICYLSEALLPKLTRPPAWFDSGCPYPWNLLISFLDARTRHEAFFGSNHRQSRAACVRTLVAWLVKKRA